MKKHNRWRKIYKAEGFKRNVSADQYYVTGKLYRHDSGSWNAIYLGKNSSMMKQLRAYRTAMKLKKAINRLGELVK